MHEIVLVIDKHWATKHRSPDTIATASECVCVSVDNSVNQGIKHSPHTHTYSIHIPYSIVLCYANYSMPYNNIIRTTMIIIDSEIIGHLLHTKTRHCSMHATLWPKQSYYDLHRKPPTIIIFTLHLVRSMEGRGTHTCIHLSIDLPS